MQNNFFRKPDWAMLILSVAILRLQIVLPKYLVSYANLIFIAIYLYLLPFRFLPLILFLFGKLYSIRLNYNSALITFRIALKLYPKCGLLHLHKGLAHLRLNQLDEALIETDRSIQLSPSSWQALNNKGVICMGLKRYEDALDNFEAALLLNPHYVMAYANKSGALNKLDKFDEALNEADIALHFDPTDGVALLNKATALLKLDRAIEVNSLFDTTNLINPEMRAHMDYIQACSLALQNNYDDSLIKLNVSIEGGFNDIDDINSNPCWDNLKNDPYFHKSLKSLVLRISK